MSSLDRHRVFIAYSSDDREYVQQLEGILQRSGLDPMWDEHLPAGAGFTDKIQLFIAHAHVFVPLITERSKDQHWVHQEIGFATALNVPVLPITINVDPTGIIQGIQAIRLDEQMTDAAKRLSRKHFDYLVEDAEQRGGALYEVAPDNVSRARLMTEYARNVHRLGRHGLVRQKGALTSFHIPDEHIDHPDWAARYGGQRRADFYCEALREERRALEEHARVSGCKLSVNLSLSFGEYGPHALPSRLRVLLAFLAKHADVESLAVAVRPTEQRGGPNLQDVATTIVGDWFLAESIKGTLGRGYEQTVFTRHAPSIRRRIRQFDEEFQLIVGDQPRGEAGSRDYAVERIEARIRECTVSARGPGLALRFDYAPESPTRHGWRIAEGKLGMLSFSKVDDAAGGTALSIRTNGTYAMDYELGDLEFPPSRARIAFRPHEGGYLYLRVALRSSEGTSRAMGWLRLATGTGEPKFIGNRGEEWWEWQWFATTRLLESNWQEIDLDVAKVVASTFGQEGQRLEALSGFRVRGSIDLAVIEVS